MNTRNRWRYRRRLGGAEDGTADPVDADSGPLQIRDTALDDE
jgi:hypothetical protein